MSEDTLPDTEVRLDTDLLELDKRVSRSSTGYPVFEYRIDYHGSPPGELTVSESLPADVDTGDVEFHPDFYGENWTCSEAQVEFEYILPDSEVVETKFGLSVENPEAVEALAGPPDVVVDDLETGERIATYAPADAETVTPEDGDGMQPVEPDPVSDTVRDIILGSKEDVTGGDAAAEADADEPMVVEPGGGDASEATPTSAAAAPDAAVASRSDDDTPDGTSAVTAPPSESAAAEESDTADDVDAEPETDEAPGDDEATADDAAPGSPQSSDDAGPPVEDDAGATADDVDAGPEAGEDPSAAGGSDDGTAADAVGGVSPASVGRALAAELRSGAIPEEDLEVLRDHLEVGGSESDRVRLEDLQSRYHDVLAYTDALEAFIDENGDADGVLADLHDDVATVEDELERLSATAERVETELATYPDADDLQERLDDIAADLDDTQETVESELASLDERLGDLEATVDDLEDQTEVLLELKDVFGGD